MGPGIGPDAGFENPINVNGNSRSRSYLSNEHTFELMGRFLEHYIYSRSNFFLWLNSVNTELVGGAEACRA